MEISGAPALNSLPTSAVRVVTSPPIGETMVIPETRLRRRQLGDELRALQQHRRVTGAHAIPEADGCLRDPRRHRRGQVDPRGFDLSLHRVALGLARGPHQIPGQRHDGEQDQDGCSASLDVDAPSQRDARRGHTAPVTARCTVATSNDGCNERPQGIELSIG